MGVKHLPWAAAICLLAAVGGLGWSLASPAGRCRRAARRRRSGQRPRSAGRPAGAGHAGGHPHQGPLADPPGRRAADDPHPRLLAAVGHFLPWSGRSACAADASFPSPSSPASSNNWPTANWTAQQALALCHESGSPVAKVFAGAVRKWGRPAVEVEQAVIDCGERVTNSLRRYLRVFYAITTVGPLLGLMGTVLGMIQTFNVIAAGDALGRAELLAGGIAKALLNTAGGLAVAIPASILYVFFVSRVDRLIIEIDALAQEVVNTISAEELQERQASPLRRPAAPPEPRLAAGITKDGSAMPLKTHLDEHARAELDGHAGRHVPVDHLLHAGHAVRRRGAADRPAGAEVVDRGALDAAAERKTVNVYRDGTITLDRNRSRWTN